jgi:hypothetical protein
MTWTELHKSVQADGVTADVLRSARTLMLAPPTELLAAYNKACAGNTELTPKAEVEAKSMVRVLARIEATVKEDKDMARVWKGRDQ